MSDPPTLNDPPTHSKLDSERFLLADERLSTPFWRNEELGERRVNFLIALVTAMVTAAVALVAHQGAPSSSQVSGLVIGACVALLAVGSVSFRRRRGATLDLRRDRRARFTRRRRLTRRAAFAATVAALALTASAAAHGPTSTQAGYVSNISALDPNVLGVFVNVIGSDVWLRLSNYSGKEIVILGYQGEPYLRFDKAGVFQNVRSPAAYINRFRGFAGVAPASASATAPPTWKKVAGGASYKWRDHRIYWARGEPPAGVKKNPDEIQRVFVWRVPGRADGKRFAITGILGYAPALAPANGSGRDWALPAAAGAAAFVAVLAGLGLWVARRSSRRATQP